jgi:phosphatidylethanolamine/phosphatidyl-N-methylethanolamine N-methyltransferase
MSNSAATLRTQARYERLAPYYDRVTAMHERRTEPWRARLWALVEGRQVLEVGVGTGRNMAYYPPGVAVTAIDLTPGMLVRAEREAARLGQAVDLQLGDVQALGFCDQSFDMAVATCVFCSVPDPVRGLAELRRVVKPGGRVLLLEHVRSEHPLVGPLMDALNPLVVRLVGANINRRTVANVEKAGLTLEAVENLGLGDIFRLIMARV